MYADIIGDIVEHGTKKLIDKAIDGDNKKSQESQNRVVSMTTQQIQTSIKSAVVLLGHKESETLTKAYGDFEALDVDEAREKAMMFFLANPAINDIKHIHLLVEKMHASVQSIGLTGGQMVKFQEFTLFLHETGQASFLPRISNVSVEVMPQKKYLTMILSGKATKFKNGRIKIQMTILDDRERPLDAQPGFDVDGKLGKTIIVSANGRFVKINQKITIPLSLLKIPPEVAKGFSANIIWSFAENNIRIERKTQEFYLYQNEIHSSAPQEIGPRTVSNAREIEKNQIILNLWGCYNIVGKSEHIKNAESNFDGNSNIKNKANATTLGGFGGGLDLLFGRKFQGGLSASYLPGYRFEQTFSDILNNKYAVLAKMDFLPLLLVGKYYVVSGLYLGAGIGIAPSLDGQESIYRNGSLYSSTPGVPSEITQNVFAWTFHGRLGFDIALGENASIGIMGSFLYLTMQLDKSFAASATGSAYVTSKTFSTWVVAPALVLSFKW